LKNLDYITKEYLSVIGESKFQRTEI